MKLLFKKTPARLICSLLAIGIASLALAQKSSKPTITREQMNQIDQIVKPVRAIIDDILAKDKTGMYARYQKDLQSLKEVGNEEQRRAITKKIISGYQSFFANVWKQAAIDEKSYQSQIRNVFPVNMREVIRFDNYLGFTMNSTTPQAPPPAPPPPDKCIDVCTIAKGYVNGTSYLISGGGGTYGNCYAKAHSWGALAAWSEISSDLKNNITVPGTFVDDGRRLAISITYDMKIEATSFAVLGGGVTSASVSNGWTSEYMMVFSPIIFATYRIQQSTVQENFIIDKKNISSYNVYTGSTVGSLIISAGWGNAEATNIRWTICETK